MTCFYYNKMTAQRICSRAMIKEGDANVKYANEGENSRVDEGCQKR